MIAGYLKCSDALAVRLFGPPQWSTAHAFGEALNAAKADSHGWIIVHGHGGWSPRLWPVDDKLMSEFRWRK